MADHTYSFDTSSRNVDYGRKINSKKGKKNCCVPYCTKTGYYQVEGHGTVSYFHFPKDPVMKKKWIISIKRDEGDFFNINGNTLVCSLHFTESDYREVSKYSGRRFINSDAVPSVFKCWEGKNTAWTEKKQRGSNKIIINREKSEKVLKSKTTGISETLKKNDFIPVCESSLLEEQTHLLQNSVLEDEPDSLHTTTLTQSNYSELLERIAELESKNSSLEAHVTSLQSENRFTIDNLDSDNLVVFYTGFPNKDTFNSLLKFLNPGDSGENLITCSKNTENKSYTRKGRAFILSAREQFFLFLVRVRLGLLEQDLACRFKISVATVSRIMITWTNFLYLKLGTLPIWPEKETVIANMPSTFKEKYPNTRIIIDCTEIKCEMPSSLVLKSKSYSNYKSSNTLKGLIGITPAGHISFVSQLYTGSISDREITIKSGLLHLPFDQGDDIMADKGFDIQDLLDPLGIHLNIPPFLHLKDQMSAEDVAKTQSVAAERIHVERIINKVKSFHIFDQVIPLSLCGSINQIWTVCALLTLFQNPIISVSD